MQTYEMETKHQEGETITFLSPTKQIPITLQTEIHVDDVGASLASILAFFFLRTYEETYSRSSLLKTGREKEKEEMERKGLDIRIQRLGEQHPDTLASMNNLGWTLVQSARSEEGEQLLKTALIRMENVVGPNHPHTCSLRKDLIRCLKEQNKQEDAKAIEDRYSSFTPASL